MNDWAPTLESFRPHEITRPHPRLMQYYLLTALLTGPLSPIVLLPLFFKYHTLRYEFDDRGVSMKWGILFRREILLTYRRIQDIHLTRNIVQRWLGLATVSLQTASGSTGAEMNIEGILEADSLRDYLYSKMRGARHQLPGDAKAGPVESPAGEQSHEALTLLREIRDSLSKVAARGETSS
ncbi:MAG: PH domain-containing protein [Pirellulales bacterium]